MAKKRSARRAGRKAGTDRSSERLHNVVIYLDPLNGRLWAEPKFLVLERRDGPHRIRYWNRTSRDITIRYPELRVGGRKSVTVTRDQKDDDTVVAIDHKRGIFKYRVTSAWFRRIPGVVAAGDPEVIVE